MENILEINQLSKVYGQLRAVDQLSLNIPKGSIYGLLGPNGSGKTTTLGMILGVLQPTAGSFRWMGRKLGFTTKQKIGAILETPNFYPYLSAKQNLKIVARIKEADPARIPVVLEQVELAARANSSFKTFSLGMKQRLAIASALLNEPEVLVLDEPTNGLDPRGIAEIRELIKEIAQQGITIILASHLLDEVEKVCSHAAVLREGRKLFSGPVAELTGQEGVIEVSAADNSRLYEVLKSHEAVKGIQQEGALLQVMLSRPFSAADINRHLAEQGIYADHLVFRKNSLEKQFLNLISAS